jgi:uncharacterized membrane protein
MNNQHSQSIHDSVAVEEWGSYNVIAVSYQEDNNAYAALSQLKELDSQGRIRLDEAAVVERLEDGRVIEKDRVDSNFPTVTVGGGLLGLLVGIIGGPFGMLIGGTSGLFAGSLVDLGDLDETESALSQVSSSAKVGHTTLLTVVAEQSPEVIDAAMDALGGTVLRRSVADVRSEIAATEDAQRKAKHEARAELMRSRRERNKEAVQAKVEELKGKLSRSEKTASAQA